MSRKGAKTAKAAPVEQPAPAPAPRPAKALWYLGALLCFWSFGYTIMMGADFFWHLASGRWMVMHRTIFNLTDPWSYTREGQPWLHHEWLSDVIYFAWYRLFGLQSIVYWKWAVIAGTYLLLMRTLARGTGSLAAAFLAALAAVAMGEPFLDVRPHLYSLLGFAVIVPLTIGRERPPSWLPAVFLVWANLHGGFFFGLMALAALLSPGVLAGPRRERLRALALWAGSAVACLLTPNGLEAFYYPIKYAFDTTSPFRTLGEWHNPFEAGGIQAPLYSYGIALFGAAGLVVLAARPLRRNIKISVAGLGLGLLTLAMSLRSHRFIPLFGMSEALVVAPAIAHVLGWLRRRGKSLLPLPDRVKPYLAPALAVGLGLLWMRPYPIRPYAFHYLAQLDVFPVNILNYVQENHLAGKLFGFYNWGGYVNLRTDGRLHVFIDGRADTVFDADTYRRYITVLGMQRGWVEVIEGSGAEMVLWPKTRGAVLKKLVESGRWRVLYEDPNGQLLVRADVKLPEPLVPSRPSAWREWTLADDAATHDRMGEAEEHAKRALEEMPHLGGACLLLAKVQAFKRGLSEGRATLARCDRIFPDPRRDQAFEMFATAISRRSGK